MNRTNRKRRPAARLNATPSTATLTLKTRCEICGSDETMEFLRCDRMPVFCNVALPVREQALSAARGDIRLRLCLACGYIFNAAYDSQLASYCVGYDNALHFSPQFQSYAHELAQRLVKDLDLRRKRIVEIGCGDGQFLALLCSLGANYGFGYDPAYHAQQDLAPAPGQVLIRQAFYGVENAETDPDFLCCRHVLEHLESPLEFLRQLRRTLPEDSDARLFFEVPDAMYMLRGFGPWDVLYEHNSYFLAAALEGLARSAGFRPAASWADYGGQYRCLLVRPCPAKESHVVLTPPGERVLLYARQFAGRFQARLETWRQCLETYKGDGRRVVFWGAGSKAVTLLNAIGDSERFIHYVVDLNPRKVGKFLPGTAQQIISPQALCRQKPDVVVVMNPIYRQEVRKMLEELGIPAQVLAA